MLIVSWKKKNTFRRLRAAHPNAGGRWGRSRPMDPCVCCLLGRGSSKPRGLGISTVKAPALWIPPDWGWKD